MVELHNAFYIYRTSQDVVKLHKASRLEHSLLKLIVVAWNILTYLEALLFAHWMTEDKSLKLVSISAFVVARINVLGTLLVK